jgi:hypothetical protein
MTLLQQRIGDAIERHGSLRAAARVLQVDHAYLKRLLDGVKDNPSPDLMRKLGIRKLTTYVPRAQSA